MIAELPPDAPAAVYSRRVRAAIVAASPYLGRELIRYGSPRLRVHAGELRGGPLGADAGASYTPSTHTITLRADLARRATHLQHAPARARLGRASRMWRDSLTRLLVHEHLHSLPSGRAAIWTGDHAHRMLEEGLVEAVAADLTAAVHWRMHGARTALGAHLGRSYRACVMRVRHASTLATGARSWRATAARRWRVGMVTAPPADRARTLERIGLSAELCA